MAEPQAGTARLEEYLRRLRAGLRGLPEAHAVEIVAEIRSHVRDSVEAVGEPGEAGLIAALQRLGPPERLAAAYAADSMLPRLGGTPAPWLVLRGIGRWARVSAAGAGVLVGSVVGYVLAGSLLLVAVVKPFAPERAGLWRLDSDSFSLHLGFGPPPVAEELLGWWIVPLGLLAGAGLFWVTLQMGVRAIRGFREQRGLPPAGSSAS